MSSLTQKTRQNRQRKHRRAGKKKKKARTQAGTPKFPIHPEGKKTAEKKPAAEKSA